MMTALCFFASLQKASALGPGMVSASLKKRWSSIWQKYWLANNAFVQRIWPPCRAASSRRVTCRSRFSRKSAEQAICVMATLTIRLEVAARRLGFDLGGFFIEFVERFAIFSGISRIPSSGNEIGINRRWVDCRDG